MSAETTGTLSNAALEAQQTEHEAKEARTMVQGIKALFKVHTDPEAHLPGEYTNRDGVQRMNRRVRATGGYMRATDPPRPGTLDHARQELQLDPRYPTSRRVPPGTTYLTEVPGPWAGVPEAIQVLRPLGRYDQVTDDAWRLVKAFCEARAVERDRQDPAQYNRVDRGQEGQS